MATVTPIAKSRDLAVSGAGILAALAVLAIFVLTAAFFKSVIFGLALAYFCLPLQAWYERRFFPSSAWRALARGASALFAPVLTARRTLKAWVAARAQWKTDDATTETEETGRVGKACVATTVTVIAVALALLTLFTWISGTYLAGASKSAAAWIKDARGNVSPPGAAAAPETTTALPAIFQKVVDKIEALRPRVESLPFYHNVIQAVKAFLSDNAKLKDFGVYLLGHSGGVFSFTAGAVNALCEFALNAALTFFFFAFFLKKMAMFRLRREGGRSAGEYLVDGIFKSGWMPETAAGTREDAREIVDTVFLKLGAWARGYLAIIVIESLFYVTAFLLLDVPYAPVLGVLAGMTVLLPFIGPIASVALTVTVCLASGDFSMVRLLFVGGAYLLMNGVIEQLFLYPRLVGGALGLNELETILVVLMGGLIAGLPGMVFAVPFASVFKYLAPKLYAFGPRALARVSGPAAATTLITERSSS